MRRRVAWRVGLVATLAAFGLACGTGALWAQGTEEVRGRLPTADEGSAEQLKRHYYQIRGNFAAMLKGEADPNPPVIETAAKYYVYRLTWAEERTAPGRLDALVHDVEQNVVAVAEKYKPNNEAFLKQFVHEMIPQLRKILRSDLPMNRINGGRLMSALARVGQDEIGDLLAEVLEDRTQLDAVKFYALQGMKQLFTPARVRPEDREARCILAIDGYLANLSSRPGDLPTEEADGIRYVRREALRALGKTRLPAVKGDSSTPPTALALLRVVAHDGITPEPSLSEEVEAAVGLAHLDPKLLDDYRPDYAAFYLGRFLVDFVRRSRSEGASAPGQKADQTMKISGLRLAEAVNVLRNFRPDDPTMAQYLEGFARQAAEPLRAIQTGEPADVSPLDTWLTQNAPKSPSLFKGNPKAVVRPQTATGG